MLLNRPLAARQSQPATEFACTIVLGLLTGCATSSTATRSVSQPVTPPPTAISATPVAAPTPSPVVRYGRYTLVELNSSGQEDLIQQIVDIAIPASLPATVGDALRYVLEHSGYRLCQGNDETNALNAMPLPAVHLHLGPLKLREALQILIGPARELTVDEITREVCIRPHALPARADSAPSLNP